MCKAAQTAANANDGVAAAATPATDDTPPPPSLDDALDAATIAVLSPDNVITKIPATADNTATPIVNDDSVHGDAHEATNDGHVRAHDDTPAKLHVLPLVHPIYIYIYRRTHTRFYIRNHDVRACIIDV